GDSLWRISKTYFSMQNSMKQEPCDFSHGRFSRITNLIYFQEHHFKKIVTLKNLKPLFFNMFYLYNYYFSRFFNSPIVCTIIIPV
ncbi:TPA: hypothetical protein JD113_07800, partial [Clostridioides difficile]|nr:hypothetical protein [Clostridioides difficile]HAU5374943.1 hypothetical protein [Clostridioides difficile]HAU5378615.1 hypothetical protein [Clostridioides difficile]